METGQDWKIAALTFNIYVHFFYGGIMKNKFMLLAIEESLKAFDIDEVPIGAIIVKNGKVIAQAHNLKEYFNCATKHAEMIAIELASSKLNNWRLSECDIYVTLEPCPMCASAIKQSRIKNIYFGLRNSDTNNIDVIKAILNKDNTNIGVNIYGGYYQNCIKNNMKNFFEKRRNID